jgi:CspA family cold shock protein
MATGSVKWFNDAKGYGFITPDLAGDDLFFHFSELQVHGFKTIKEGKRVEYTVVPSEKGPKATGVRQI